METKITQMLDSKGITYRLLPHVRAVFTCEEAAKERGIPLEEMIKCILLVDKKKSYFLACLTSDRMVDPQKVRELVNCTRLSFASEQEVEEILGYKTGAIPPLLLKTDIPIVFDEEIIKRAKVNISSASPIAGIELTSNDLISLVRPIFGKITK